jgi:hypothetical protein
MDDKQLLYHLNCFETKKKREIMIGVAAQE